jgi:hypothetical protein
LAISLSTYRAGPDPYPQQSLTERVYPLVCALVGKSDLTAWGAHANSGPHNTCLPRPEAPRHVSSGRCMYPATYADTCITRAQRRARTRHTHLDPGDVHPTPHTRTTLSRAGEQPTQLTQPCNYTVVHHYRYTHVHHFRYEHGDDSTPLAPR